MKNLTKNRTLFLVAIIAASLFCPQKTQARPGVGISFQVFYDNLEPYGRWINSREHGYVWIPDAEPGFQPYATRGHWIITSYGNTWVSDYPWGWATFHYGRWHFDDFYGWKWIPGDEWGPAWVNWRSGNGYYGWTPMEPGIRINISINIPSSRWIFVPQRYICHPQVYNYYSPRTKIKTIIHNTTVINNYYVYNNRNYVSGPATREIERVTHTRVPVYRINNEPRPGYARAQNGSIGLYRPEIDRRNGTGAPSRIADVPNNRNSPNINSQGNTVYGNQPGTSRPDRVSNSQTITSGQPENRNTRIDANRDDQTTSNPPSAESKDVFNRQRDERIIQAPNPNNSPNERIERAGSQPKKVEEKREDISISSGRFQQRQENNAPQRKSTSPEPSRQQRLPTQQQARPEQRSREQNNQQQPEQKKDQPSGRDAPNRQRPGRI